MKHLRKTRRPNQHLACEVTAAMDLGLVTHQCPCGSSWWQLSVTFDDFEIAGYLLEMTCSCCGTRALAPTPLDRDECWPSPA